MAPSVADAKKALRRKALDQRKNMKPPFGTAEAARDRFLATLGPSRPAIVSGYVAMRGELDPRPVLLTLEAAGSHLVLPFTVGEGLPLRFLEAPGGLATSTDAYGIDSPPETAPEHYPDILIVPLAAFDRRGYRMGYGGGFYDAALARLRVEKPIVAVGWAFAAQEVPEVPTEAHDVRLDWIVTEREAIYISGQPL